MPDQRRALKINRDMLASFLGRNPELIRRFENLFYDVAEALPSDNDAIREIAERALALGMAIALGVYGEHKAQVRKLRAGTGIDIDRDAGGDTLSLNLAYAAAALESIGRRQVPGAKVTGADGVRTTRQAGRVNLSADIPYLTHAAAAFLPRQDAARPRAGAAAQIIANRVFSPR